MVKWEMGFAFLALTESDESVLGVVVVVSF